MIVGNMGGLGRLGASSSGAQSSQDVMLAPASTVELTAALNSMVGAAGVLCRQSPMGDGPRLVALKRFAAWAARQVYPDITHTPDQLAKGDAYLQLAGSEVGAVIQKMLSSPGQWANFAAQQASGQPLRTTINGGQQRLRNGANVCTTWDS